MRAVRRIQLRQRQGEPEGRAVAWRALDADGTAVPLDDGAADGEAQAQADAGPILLLDAWHTVEPLEEVGLLLWREAGPVVAHLDPRRVATHAQPHRHRRVLSRVFEGVGQVVSD